MYRWSSLYEIWNVAFAVFAVAVPDAVGHYVDDDDDDVVMATTVGTSIVDISDNGSYFSMHKYSFETQSKLFTLLLSLFYFILIKCASHTSK